SNAVAIRGVAGGADLHCDRLRLVLRQRGARDDQRRDRAPCPLHPRSRHAKGAILLEFPACAMPLFDHASFLRAAGRVADLPAPGPPEIAFAGRSNVGKSSAINALAGRNALARTSKTPGRTQTINFYEIGEEARLVDLPGYGYARVSQELRKQWRELVDSYLSERVARV